MIFYSVSIEKIKETIPKHKEIDERLAKAILISLLERGTSEPMSFTLEKIILLNANYVQSTSQLKKLCKFLFQNSI